MRPDFDSGSMTSNRLLNQNQMKTGAIAAANSPSCNAPSNNSCAPSLPISSEDFAATKLPPVSTAILGASV
ncbi:hypothetical protein D3C80_2212530 [compost metagenome]